MTVRQLGAAALTASFFKENGKDDLSAWVISVKPLSTDDASSVTYYVGDYRCYPQE